MATIDIDDLADVIAKELRMYSEEVTEQLKEDIKQVAKECVGDIKKNAPKDTGAYKRNWKVKVAYENTDDIRVIIHNRKHYQLTHLLENGHAKVGGGRVEGKPHIRPAERKAEQSLLQKVKVNINGGSR